MATQKAALKKSAPKKTAKPPAKSKPAASKAKAKKNENKMQQTNASVDAFIDKVADETRRDDCRAVIQLMQKISGEEPRMWGSSIVGFGKYHYIYASGREGDMPVTGFSPRKTDLTVYVMGVFERHPELLKKLGKCKTSKACLYLKKLGDVDMAVLEEIIRKSIEYIPTLYSGHRVY